MLRIDCLTFKIMTDSKYSALFGNGNGLPNLPIDEPERDRIRQELRDIKKRQYKNFHMEFFVTKAPLKFLEQTKEVLKFAIACSTECSNGKVFDTSRIAIELAEKLVDLAFELGKYLPHTAEGLLVDKVYQAVVQRMGKIDKLSEYLWDYQEDIIDEPQSETLNWSKTLRRIDAQRQHALSSGIPMQTEQTSQQHARRPEENVELASKWASTLTALTGTVVLLAFVPALFA